MGAVSTLARLLAPLERRLRVMVTRGVLRLIDADTLLQTLQVQSMSAHPLDGVEHFEAYGYTSHPHPGAEVLLAALGGRCSHTVCLVASDRRYRKRGLLAGEVALYTDEGDYIQLKRGRVVQVVAGAKLDVTAPEVVVTAASSVTLDTPQCTITGNLSVGGNVAVAGVAAVQGALSSAASVADPGGTMQGMRGTYNTHTHPGDSGGTTGAPNQGM